MASSSARYLRDPNEPLMLPHAEALRDVPDVELLCRGVIATKRKAGALRELTDDEYDELLLDLLTALYEIERDYDPARGVAFRSYAFWKLGLFVIDRIRKIEGRKGQRRAPLGSVSLSELDGDRLGGALTSDEVGGGASGLADLARALEGRSSPLDPHVAGQGDGTSRRAGRGDQRAGERSAEVTAGR